VNATDFWPRAWSASAYLSVAPDAASEKAVVEALAGDWNLQWYCFRDPDVIDLQWLAPLVRHGLFSNPPPVERDGDTRRARGWPPLRFLKRCIPTDAAIVARVLSAIETDNWWVTADALDIAVALPRSHAVPLILRSLDQWQRATVSWLRPDLLTEALGRLAEGNSAFATLQQGVFFVASRVLNDSELEYEYENEISEHIIATERKLLPAALDGIEAALAANRTDVEPPWVEGRYAYSTPPTLLLNTWAQGVGLEDPGTALIRAARLANSASRMRRSMSALALQHALAARPDLTSAARLLERLMSDLPGLDYPFEFRGALACIGPHFGLASSEAQTALLTEVRRMADSENVRDRHAARDMLASLEGRLGVDDTTTLERLVEAHGPFRELERGVTIAISVQSLSRMSPEALKGLVRFPPGGTTRTFYGGPNIEGFRSALRACVQERFAELLPHLADLARVARDSPTANALVWGAREAIQAGTTPAGGQDALLAFLEATAETVARLEGTRSEGESDIADYGLRSLTRGLADIVDTGRTWLFDERATLGDRITDHLAWLMASSDPSAWTEQNDTGHLGDPPSAALNSTRGGALIAAFNLLTLYWADDGPEADSFAESIHRLITESVTDPNPAVRSVYGLYLPQIIHFWRDLLDTHERDLLPTDDDRSSQWEAVFATYVRFAQPHRASAQRITTHFKLGVERLADPSYAYLSTAAERLLTHLIVLAMPRADGSEAWLSLAFHGFAVAEDQPAAKAINSLAHAARIENLDLPTSWYIHLIEHRASALRETSVREGEASALLRLALAAKVPVEDAIGVLLTLIELGATTRGKELVEYLTVAGDGSPEATATIFASALRHGMLSQRSYFADEALLPLLESTAAGAPEATWEIVNKLGESGALVVEGAALQLQTELGPSAGPQLPA
jgi:hypothetical protein